MDFLNNTILNIFLLTPLVFVLLNGAFIFIKNPIYIKNLNRFFFLVQFLFTVVLLVFFKDTQTTFFKFDFSFDSLSSILVFVNSLVFFLFSVVSKTFFVKLIRTKYITLLMLNAVSNIFLLSDNIFLNLTSVFWILLIQHYLNQVSNEDKKPNNRLAIDLFWFILGCFLITVHFLRYFLINEIPFNFSNITANLYHINDFYVLLAFFGFLIIIFRLFKFIPFYTQRITCPFVSGLNTISSLILGSFLFVKTYLVFDYLYYQYQNYIVLFLLFNFIYFLLFNIYQKKLIDFANSSLAANLLICLFLLFSFEDSGFVMLVYSLVVLILSYTFIYFILSILANRFNIDSFESMKKIDNKDRLAKFFIAVSFLNISKVPLLPMFIAMFNGFLVIFSYEFESNVLNLSVWTLVLGAFILSLSSLFALLKILVSPIRKGKKSVFCFHQIAVFWILTLILLFLGIAPNFSFDYIVSTFGSGIF